MAFITKSYQNLFGVRSYINAFCNGAWVVIAEVGKNVYTD